MWGNENQTKKSSDVPITGGCPLRLNFFPIKFDRSVDRLHINFFFHFPVWPGINLFRDIREMFIQRLLYCRLIFLNVNIIEWSLIKGLLSCFFFFFFFFFLSAFYYCSRKLVISIWRQVSREESCSRAQISVWRFGRVLCNAGAWA